MTAAAAPGLDDIYHRLLLAYGPQGWWPADDAFEIMAGAVLTQNAAWTNVEYALSNLRDAEALEPEALLGMDQGRLARLIRPSGYFNVKAKRLGALCRFLVDAGGIEGLAALPTDRLRASLLAVHGIGRETADDIVLYAFSRPVFVIDAYTRRIFARLGLFSGDEHYEHLRSAFEDELGADAPLFMEYHGLVVRHAKAACRVRPACDDCCLRSHCPVGRGESWFPSR